MPTAADRSPQGKESAVIMPVDGWDTRPCAAMKCAAPASAGRDHLYSVSALTDTTGAVVERYGYDAYGERIVLDSSGTTELAGSTVGQPYGFTGRRFDEETGLWYFRARYYDGELGRFLTRDSASTVVHPATRTYHPSPLTGYMDGLSFYNGYFSPGSLDPWGWNDEDSVIVVISDNEEDGGDGLAGGDEYEGAAGDHDGNNVWRYNVGDESPDDIADDVQRRLQEDPDKNVSEVHIYDHGQPAGQEMGNYMYPGTDEIWRRLGSGAGTTIYFHGCNIAEIRGKYEDGQQFLLDVSETTGGTAVGWTGVTRYYAWYQRWLYGRFKHTGLRIVCTAGEMDDSSDDYSSESTEGKKKKKKKCSTCDSCTP